MTYKILWPTQRWDAPHQIEIDSVKPDGEATIVMDMADVTDEQWRSADGVVSVLEVPEVHRAKLDNCRIFIKPAVGFDNIDTAAWGALGIPVCNVPDYGTQEVADHALALMLAVVRCIPMHLRRLAADPINNWEPANNPYARRLSSSVCGIVGLGRIGTAFALRAKALGMDVVIYDPYVPNGAELALNVRRVRSLAELFGQSDIVSVHVPLSAGTRNLIDAEVLSHAKQDLILINSARGPVVDVDALHDALKSGQVRAAGLDVLPEEPPDLERPLLKAWAADEAWLQDRLLITPHSAFSTPESVYDMRFKGGEVALRYLRDGVLENCVNEAHLAHRR